MAVSLYDISIGSYLQILASVSGFLEKGRAHCEEVGIDLAEVTESCLFSDMLPLRFQIVSVAHHSLGAIKAAESGLFLPPSMSGQSYEELQQLVTETQSALEAYTPETVNALAGKDMVFQLGERSLPFLVEDFLLTFSLPNFYFHATTAYDILRNAGVPLGKRDFLGRLRLNKT